MTYFAFLALFIGIPLIILSVITMIDYRRGKWQPQAFHAWKPWKVLFGLCVVALIYTTPWDNYLVATGVWFYDPSLVTGIVMGYVPIEEYTFFVVLPLMTGLWTLLLMRYLPAKPTSATYPQIRLFSTGLMAIVWLVFCIMLMLTFSQPSGFASWTYLALLLAWALIPILIQLAFGADILWRHKWIVFWGILVPTLYLSWADSIAIHAGIWAIEPAQSLPLLFGGVLPVEEVVFFALVNTLVVIGLTLVLAEESQPRAMTLERFAVLRPFIQRTIKKWQSAPEAQP